MIASLEGKILAIGTNYLVVNMGGIGLRVYVPAGILDNLNGPGTHIRLFTHLHVRENELSLYGCSSQEELDLFDLLLDVSGVGPKLALAILSTLSPQSLRIAIAQEQGDVLSQVSGVGPKMAGRIIFQLKDKVKVEEAALEPAPKLTDTDAEVIAALTTLGYSVVEAQTALQNIPRDTDLTLEDRVRLALAYFG